MSGALLLCLAFSLTIRQDQYPLRTGCAEDDDVIARAGRGTPAEIRFGRVDSTGLCYKIAVRIEGRTVEGYVPARALDGLEEYERERRSAGQGSVRTDRVEVESIAQSAAGGAVGDPLSKASALLQQNQPAQALAVLEPLLERYRKDPNLLAIAGMAAYRSDLVERAIGYWKDSLELQPNPAVERWYKKVQREAAADKGGERLYGTRFLLRYEDAVVPAETARSMIAALEEEYSRVAGVLGCSTPERIVAIVESPQAYRKATDAAEWTAAQYDGKIRVGLLEGGGFGELTRRAFRHEIVHACMASLGTFPVWLHEGMAQKLSGEAMGAAERQKIRAGLKSGTVPRLDRLSQTWSRMSTEHAMQAYGMAYLAAEWILDAYQAFGIQNLLKNPQMLAQAAAEAERRLRE